MMEFSELEHAYPMVNSSMNTNLSFRTKQFTEPYCPGFSPSTLHAGPNQSLAHVRIK